MPIKYSLSRRLGRVHYDKFPTGFIMRVTALLSEGWGAGVFCADFVFNNLIAHNGRAKKAFVFLLKTRAAQPLFLMPFGFYWCRAWMTCTPARHGRRAGLRKCFMDLSRVLTNDLFFGISLACFFSPYYATIFLSADNRGTKKGCFNDLGKLRSASVAILSFYSSGGGRGFLRCLHIGFH
jgi:hypothetical protein